MIKITMRNGFYYKGELINESDEFLKIKDINGEKVEIRKEDISVRTEVEEK